MAELDHGTNEVDLPQRRPRALEEKPVLGGLWGFRVLGFRVWGLGFRFWGLGFGVLGFTN